MTPAHRSAHAEERSTARTTEPGNVEIVSWSAYRGQGSAPAIARRQTRDLFRAHGARGAGCAHTRCRTRCQNVARLARTCGALSQGGGLDGVLQI
eukprot:18938-Prymnesium_polylepis.1